MHYRLHITPQQSSDPVSFILNKLPKSAPTSTRRINFLKTVWPIICTILAELDAHQHPDSDEQQYYNPDPGRAFLNWIDPPSSDHG
ncbi:hypothetical protein BDC45DRAFT_130241 [Circinella umbellata]|nr:hypothetical protein BDC45DRAFT_130241 [Circinella umbellata]